MPLPDPIVPAGAPLVSWTKLREAVGRCVAAAAPLARTHNEWKLSFDMTKNVSLLTVLAANAHQGEVHSWMVGIANAEPTPNAIGGAGFEFFIDFAIWGFMGYSLSDGSATLEDEARLVAATLWASKKVGLTLEDPRGLREVHPLRFGSIDVHPFTEGVDVWVAQGSMRTRIEDIF